MTFVASLHIFFRLHTMEVNMKENFINCYIEMKQFNGNKTNQDVFKSQAIVINTSKGFYSSLIG